MGDISVSELTVDELKILISETVADTLWQLLGDPDEDLDLRKEIKDRLQRSLRETTAGAKTIPAEKVAARLGLEW